MAAAILAGESRPEAMGLELRIWDRGDEDEINASIEALGQTIAGGCACHAPNRAIPAA